MRDAVALRNIFESGVLFITASLVFLEIVSIAINLRNDYREDPLNAVKNFFEALASHRYSEACALLIHDLRQKVDENMLKSQVQAIEDLHLGIREVVPIQWEKAGDMIQASVLVKTGNSEQNLVVPMKKEAGSWKLASLAPLHSLVVIGIRHTVY